MKKTYNIELTENDLELIDEALHCVYQEFSGYKDPMTRFLKLANKLKQSVEKINKYKENI